MTSIRFYDYDDEGEIFGLYVGPQLISLHDSKEAALAAAADDISEYADELRNPIRRGRAGQGDPRPAFH